MPLLMQLPLFIWIKESIKIPVNVIRIFWIQTLRLNDSEISKTSVLFQKHTFNNTYLFDIFFLKLKSQKKNPDEISSGPLFL